MSNVIGACFIGLPSYQLREQIRGGGPCNPDHLNEVENASLGIQQQRHATPTISASTSSLTCVFRSSAPDASWDISQQGSFVGYNENNNPSSLVHWIPEDIPLLSQQYLGWRSRQPSSPLLPGIIGPNNLGVSATDMAIANTGMMVMGTLENGGLSQELDSSPHSPPEDLHPFVPPLGWEFCDEAILDQPIPVQNMQPLPFQIFPPQPAPPSNDPYHHAFPSYDNSSVPLASDSSSQGGAVRTTRISSHHTPYAPLHLPPLTVVMGNQNPPFWVCHWDGCNDVFSSLEDLERHVLRPKKRERHVSTHGLPQGNSKKIPCRWGDCSESVYGVWRHIISEAHLKVRFYCASCNSWSSRQHTCP